MPTIFRFYLRPFLSKTIASGTVVSTQGEDSRLEITYKNLVFDSPTACAPVSGSLSGAVFNAAETDAGLTFTVTYVHGYATIEFSNGESESFVVEDCSPE
jgi:hypothetical protein